MGCLLSHLPGPASSRLDPPGEKKAGEGLQCGVSAHCVPPEGDSLLDTTALESYAHTSPWEWLTPLVLAPAAALALARDGSCSAGSCHGAWLLPAKAAVMGLGAAQAKGAPVVLITHPERAGWQGLLGQPTTAGSAKGAPGKHSPS